MGLAGAQRENVGDVDTSIHTGQDADMLGRRGDGGVGDSGQWCFVAAAGAQFVYRFHVRIPADSLISDNAGVVELKDRTSVAARSVAGPMSWRRGGHGYGW